MLLDRCVSLSEESQVDRHVSVNLKTRLLIMSVCSEILGIVALTIIVKPSSLFGDDLGFVSFRQLTKGLKVIHSVFYIEDNDAITCLRYHVSCKLLVI